MTVLDQFPRHNFSHFTPIMHHEQPTKKQPTAKEKEAAADLSWRAFSSPCRRGLPPEKSKNVG
ncbi:MAG: hypothetical protein GY696_27590 [Gammaproteobacteria bacterium]|nr:hypothetical protein [Gammaproteobacteria bacterium]